MKRIERNTLNHLRKTVDASCINVEIPTSYTKEGRQGIHQMLTTEEHMVAVRINWNSIVDEYVIHYIPCDGIEEFEAKRMQQENMDIDQIMETLPKSDYTWNGYKKPSEDDTTIDTISEEEETMKSTNTTKITDQDRAFWFRKGYDDAQQHAIKYGLDDVGTMIADYIKVVNVQNSWDEMEFAYVEGMLTYMEAQKIPQEA